MGFFQRMANLWTGFLNIWISDVEKEHPEIAYENSINAMVEKYTKLKKATAAIIRRREDLSARFSDKQKAFDQVLADLNTAVDTERDDLAIVLIQKKNTFDNEILELREDLALAEKDADEAKDSLLNIQNEIEKLKSERERMLAKMHSAKARIQIQEQLEGLSVDAEVKALDNVRDHIKTTVAEAKLNKELAGTSLDGQLQALRKESGSATARAELEKIKAARIARASQKTM